MRHPLRRRSFRPDIVVCSGDLTTYGFKEEYAQAKRYLDRIECKSFVVVPGNHDSRNVGYVHGSVREPQLGAPEGWRHTHFDVRDSLTGGTRAMDKYLDRFADIRRVQDVVVDRARSHGVPVVEGSDPERALTEVLGLIGTVR